MRRFVLGGALAIVMASGAVAGSVPGTGFIITGEGEPVVDMSVPIQNVGDVDKTRTEICRSVAAMRGSDTVYSADYVEGVDAYGREVAPADVASDTPQIVPDTLEIPVRIDVLQAIGIESYGGLDMLPHIGVMRVSKDGRVTYNGRDLTPEFQVICNPN